MEDEEVERPARTGQQRRGSTALVQLSDLIVLWSAPTFQRALFVVGGGAVGDLLSSQLLYRLALYGPRAPSRLADDLQTSRSNTSKVCRRLESAGLIARHQDPDDGRGVTVALTATGRSAAQRLLDAGEQVMAEVVATWDDADVGEFTRLLSRFTEGARAHAAALTDAPRDGAPP